MTGAIVHVSADYPDGWNPSKTTAIRALIELAAPRFDQRVISLNRTSPGFARWLAPALEVEAIRDGALTALRYTAPPKGLWHWTLLTRLGAWLADDLSRGPRPALLVGHKLCFEGIAVAHAARLLGVPYALTLQGDSDFKLLGARPDLAGRLGRIFHGAATVFAFAPWTIAAMERRMGKRTGPTVLVPCPTAADTPIAPVVAGGGLVSAFHLRSRRRKNLAGLVRAATRAQRKEPALELAIVGGGDAADEAAVDRAIGSRRFITREGPVPHEAMGERLNRAAGFVLPSLRESFGLVFIEALFAGLPIAYPRGWAVDGWFDDCPFALAVDAEEPRAIAGAMLRLLREEAALKAALTAWQQSDHAQRFRRAAIGEAFADALGQAIAGAA